MYIDLRILDRPRCRVCNVYGIDLVRNERINHVWCVRGLNLLCRTTFTLTIDSLRLIIRW